MQKNPIGWVEIPVRDIDRAEKFYAEFFGIVFERQPEANGYVMSFFPMDMNSYGSAAALVQGEHYTPSYEGSVVYFTAPDGTVEKALEKAHAQNIKVIVPKMSIGENGYIAFIEDSEGNRIALHSMEG